MSDPLLEIRNLRVRFGETEVVRGVDLKIFPGQTLCLVGESGSGKTLTALSLLHLLPSNAQMSADYFLFAGRDLRGANKLEMQSVRGSGISMIFQEPATALNPVYSVGFQVSEAVRAHHPELSSRERREKVVEAFTRVEISDPDRRFSEYPHQLSGGMRQRVLIAMALVSAPQLLIADEPTSSLDVMVQEQILDLLKSFGRAMLFITHDYGVVAQMADEVAVMREGRIESQGPTEAIFASGIQGDVPSVF